MKTSKHTRKQTHKHEYTQLASELPILIEKAITANEKKHTRIDIEAKREQRETKNTKTTPRASERA